MIVSSRFRNVCIVACATICLSIQIGCQPETSEPNSETVAKATPEAPVADKAVTPPTEPKAKTDVVKPPVAEKAVTPPEPEGKKTEVVNPPVAKKAVEPSTEPNATTETSKPAPPEFVNALFEAPFRLMVGNEPLNVAAKQMYPSPGMFDVDNDGQTELIVGDIFGSLNVYENQSDGDSDPVWSKHYALKKADGKPIKVSNW